MANMIAMLLAIALQTMPQPGKVMEYGDWAAACDNGRRCTMTSLMPESAGEDDDFWPGMTITREAGPAGGFTISFPLDKAESGELQVLVDGKMISRAKPAGKTLRFNNAKAAVIVAAMVSGKRLTVLNFEGSELGSVSLAGSAAALRYFDAEQRRAGTVTATVAKGAKAAGVVPAAPALPRITAVRPTGKAAPVGKALTATLLKRLDCDNPEDAALTIAAYPLNARETLLLVPCGAGAYNFMSVPMILGGGIAADATFDHVPDFAGGDAHPTLVNAGFDPTTGRLTSYAKGRGPGDCGNSEEYAWDGGQFRLVRATAMNECRGSMEWLTVWRAEVAAR